MGNRPLLPEKAPHPNGATPETLTLGPSPSQVVGGPFFLGERLPAPIGTVKQKLVPPGTTWYRADLAEKLAAVGVKENERNISNKIGRGSFTAVFFFQCMEAIGCQTLHLSGD